MTTILIILAALGVYVVGVLITYTIVSYLDAKWMLEIVYTTDRDK